MKNATVLVTGGAGFIGSNLAHHLADDNTVIAIDDCSLGTPDYLDSSVTFHEQTVLDDDLPTDVDAVVHLAALSSYGMHEDAPVRGARVNVDGFVNTVTQAREDGCQTIVYASTSSIYGSQTDPSPENLSVAANTGYEASKLARERYGEYFSNHYDMTVAGLRFFSVYQGYGGAEGHKGTYANIIAQFADAIANGRPPVLYGDGTQSRDFTHVDDVVRGIELALDHSLTGIYNLGTGTRHSFNSVVDRLNEELGTSIEPTYTENPIPEDVYVYHTCADPEKLKAATGWEPQVSFADGIRRVCEHYS